MGTTQSRWARRPESTPVLFAQNESRGLKVKCFAIIHPACTALTTGPRVVESGAPERARQMEAPGAPSRSTRHIRSRLSTCVADVVAAAIHVLLYLQKERARRSQLLCLHETEVRAASKHGACKLPQVRRPLVRGADDDFVCKAKAESMCRDTRLNAAIRWAPKSEGSDEFAMVRPAGVRALPATVHTLRLRRIGAEERSCALGIHTAALSIFATFSRSFSRRGLRG
eukprot:scaffold48_cov311-Pinguiococcus_pyrenoidosus.AAC.70